MTGVAKQSFASPFIRKNATLNTNPTHPIARPDSNCGQQSESRPRWVDWAEYRRYRIWGEC